MRPSSRQRPEGEVGGDGMTVHGETSLPLRADMDVTQPQSNLHEKGIWKNEYFIRHHH